MRLIERYTKSLLIPGVTLALLLTNTVSAADRLGLMYPEQKQKQAAMAAATIGKDEALAAPAIDPMLDKLELLVPFEEPSAIEKNAEEQLAPISFEDQTLSQSVTTNLEQFGYNIFSTLPTTFVPVEGIPVPPDYIVGPGDTFQVQIFGGTDVKYTLVVNREGKLLLPEIGDLQLSGLTFEESKTLLKETISATRIGAKVVVTLDQLHTIQIMMVGEVVQPGSYTVSGLSSLLNTLISTGGIKRTGSLRNIQVRRSGEIVARFDLYNLLLRGDETGNVFLRQGDVIFIPPIGNVISVAGEVTRPAIYELKDESTISDVIDLAGGLLPTAAAEKTQIERVSSSGGYRLVQADLLGEGVFTPVKNGDLVRVFPVLDRVDNVVLLSGNILTPGGYEWMPGMRLSDLLNSREILRQGTDFSIALIQREDRVSKTSRVRYFDLGAALNRPGSDADPELEARDRILIFDKFTERGGLVADVVNKIRQESEAGELPMTVEVLGYARHPGVYPLESGARVLEVLEYAGGLGAGIDRDYSLLVRTDPLSRDIEFVRFSLAKGLENRRGDHNPVVLPGDKIYLFDTTIDRSGLISSDIERLRSQTRYGESTPVVEVSGRVSKPGLYPLTPGMRLADLIKAAGGMAEDAFGLSASLARQVRLDGEFSKTDQLDVSLVQNDPMINTTNLILQPYDHLVLRQKPEWINTPIKVSVQGEVIYPGTYEVDKKETLCGLMQKVGGFTEDAYLFGTVFTRESVRKREQEAINRIQRQLDDLLADVHLSPGVNKDNKLPAQQGASDTFQIIQQLQPEKAAGRMVIDMESAVANCDESSDFLLENGDVVMVPKYLEEVSVVGQVYFPSSHQFRGDRGAYDYINLSGGTKELAQREHAYIVQANGEVMTVRSMASTWGWLLSPSNLKVTPGSTIYVPLSVDRINGREFAQSWVDLVYKLTLSAASIDFLFSGN